MNDQPRLSNICAFSTIDGFWRPERVAKLRELRAQGLSNLQIARALGAKSRAAISGKLHRLGLGLETSAPQPLSRVSSTHVEKRVKEIKQSRPMEALVRTAPAPRPPGPALQPDGFADIAVEAGASRVSLLSAAPDQCRWPAADDGSATMVCGAIVHTGSYCTRHALRMFARPVASRREAATA